MQWQKFERYVLLRQDAGFHSAASADHQQVDVRLGPAHGRDEIQGRKQVSASAAAGD
jgi:hypothetical protein